MDSVEGLDISWIEKHERLLNIHENYQREFMDSIQICYIYVDLDSAIQYVIYENENLIHSNKYCSISKERVLQLVQNKKIFNHLKYSIDSILLYNVSVEPENIQKYVNSEMTEPFLKIYPIIDEIIIHPSIFIFHETNCIYFVFKQNPIKNIPKSILKTSSDSKGKKTKRVRIQDDILDIKKHNITKKNIIPLL